MKTLLIMRHGKSSWKYSHLADHDRPLNSRGIRDSARIGEVIRSEGLTPDVILCSSAKRANQTAELVAENCRFSGNICLHRSLYHGDPQDYLELLVMQEENIIMVIGHNPGLEELLLEISETDEWLPTATIAQIVFTFNNWKDLEHDPQGRLIRLWRPREFH